MCVCECCAVTDVTDILCAAVYEDTDVCVYQCVCNGRPSEEDEAGNRLSGNERLRGLIISAMEK